MHAYTNVMQKAKFIYISFEQTPSWKCMLCVVVRACKGALSAVAASALSKLMLVIHSQYRGQKGTEREALFA